MKKILQKMGVVLMIMMMFFNYPSTVVMASEVEVPYFIINGSKITVKSSADVVDEGYYNQTGKTYDGDGFPYTVSLTGIFTRTLDFEVDGTEKGTISGLVDGGSYSVTIATGKELPAYLYLKGSGTITS